LVTRVKFAKTDSDQKLEIKVTVTCITKKLVRLIIGEVCLAKLLTTLGPRVQDL